MSDKINLSECQEYELRGGVVLKVYPAPLETILSVTKQIEDLADNMKLDEQIKIFVDIVFELVSEDNPSIKKESLIKTLSIQACITILQKAMGGINPFGNVAV